MLDVYLLMYTFLYVQGEENALAMSSLVNILRNVDKVPNKWKKAIRNNAGGYV